MERLTARDFDPAVLKLFDQYVHGQLSRRGFLDGAARYTTVGLPQPSLVGAIHPGDVAVGLEEREEDAAVEVRHDVRASRGRGRTTAPRA